MQKETTYKKIFSFRIDEDELDVFREAMCIATKAKDNENIDETAKILATLNKLAGGKSEWERSYQYHK